MNCQGRVVREGEDASRILDENRSETSAAHSDNLDQSASQDAPRILDENCEEESTLETRKRNRRVDAKPRGVNKCKRVANLKQGEKLEVDIYDNGPAGDNHKDMTRHMGKLVRDRTICPVRVPSWGEIDNSVKKHMWQSFLNKFAGKGGIELDRTTTIEHMRRLWVNWRGILMQNSIIKKGGLAHDLDSTPNDLTPEDWELLVKEHFSSDKFKKVSAKNSSNRENLTMPPRTGSMPIRQVIWEDMGGKEGAPRPPLSVVFKRTRMKKSGGLGEQETKKYNEIVGVEKDNPSLSQFEIAEKCFGQQASGSVVCFSSCIRPKDVRGPLPSRLKLMTRLQEKQRENDDLRKRVDEMEKAHQQESETNNRMINLLEEKLDMLLSLQGQQSTS